MQLLSGMRAFFVVWIGQVVSLLGSTMTAAGLSFWLFEQTGEASTLTWALVANFAPNVLFSPIMGTIVDRYDRKKILILSDGIAGVSSIILLVLLLGGSLEIWQIYLLNFVNGVFSGLQWPAFSSATTMMLDKKHYARASGMMSIAESGSNIFAPAAAAALYAFSGLLTIFIIDITSFVVAIGALFFIFIPSPAPSPEGVSTSFWQEMMVGFRFIWRRRPLLYLQTVFLVVNFTAAFGYSILVPLILASTGGDELVVGTVQSISAVGGVLGGLLLSAWGGPQRRVYGVLGGMLATSLLGELLIGIGGSFIWWSIGGFFANFFIPILNGSNQAIWQAKVPPDIQGRVFSVRSLIARVAGPLAIAMAGPLADHVFEPALMAGGRLVPTFGWLVGTGPGAGMSLMYVLASMASILTAVTFFFVPQVRQVETLLPDHVSV